MEPGFALSNYQIDRHFKGTYRYGGCFSKDKLPTQGPRGKFFVINLQDLNGGDRKGSHWVGVISCKIPDKNPDYTIYYDPFGLAPPPGIARWMAKSHLPVVHVTDQHQPIDSSACGWYVIRVIEGILKSVPYKQIFDKLLKEDRYSENEKWVRKLKLRT